MNRALLSLLCSLALTGGAFSQNPGEPDAEVHFTKTGENYTFSWLSRLGRTYFIQHSEDLVTWHYLSDIVTGDGSRIDFGAQRRYSIHTAWELVGGNAPQHVRR